QLEDVRIEPPAAAGVVKTPEPLDPEARFLVLVFKEPGELPRLHLLGEGDQLGVRVVCPEPVNPGADLLGAQPRPLLGTKLFQACDDLGGSHRPPPSIPTPRRPKGRARPAARSAQIPMTWPILAGLSTRVDGPAFKRSEFQSV